MIFFIKHCAGVLGAPLVLAMLVAAVAAVFRMRGRRRIAAWLWVSAAATVYLGATGLVDNMLLGPLQREYPTLPDRSLPAVRYIVVLGSGYEPRDDIPVTAALDEDGLVRVVAGVRLVSGGGPPEETPSTFGYAKLARGLGVDDASLVVLSGLLDTSDEARSVVVLLGAVPFILVTSAYHMPRAMQLMERAEAHPFPAPTGQLVNESANSGRSSLLPISGGLGKTERALHEYLGLAALAVGVDE